LGDSMRGVDMKQDLYLDLDGVILRRTGRIEFGGRTEFDVAPGAIEFLAWAADHFNCYWLTSRSHDGGYKEIERAFRFAIPTNTLPDEIKELIRAIRPAPWGTAKVEGIDLSRPFFWLDDHPDQTSVDALEEAGLLERLVIVSVDRRSDGLVRLRKFLRDIVSSGMPFLSPSRKQKKDGPKTALHFVNLSSC
jgi:hypothetical protein